jgi:hypothetical protein
MKKCFIVLMTTVLSLCLVGAALAINPPKTLAFLYDSGFQASMLQLKPSGNLKTAGGTVKTYTITGIQYFGHFGDFFPVSGSGYVLDSIYFHFTYQGMDNVFTGDPFPGWGMQAEGTIWDMQTSIDGAIAWGYHDYSGQFADYFGYQNGYTLIDTTAFIIPFKVKAADKADKAGNSPVPSK